MTEGTKSSSKSKTLKAIQERGTSAKKVIEEELQKLSTANSEEEDMKKKVKLRTADNVTFEVERLIVKEMQTVQSFIDNSGIADDSVIIPLPNVSSYCLALIIEYCKEHCRATGADKLDDVKEHLKAFDERFIKRLNTDDLKELILAANYLNMETFQNFVGLSIANVIKNKSPEFVRDFFGIATDYTPEEEAEVRRQVAWSFQNIDQD